MTPSIFSLHNQKEFSSPVIQVPWHSSLTTKSFCWHLPGHSACFLSLRSTLAVLASTHSFFPPDLSPFDKKDKKRAYNNQGALLIYVIPFIHDWYKESSHKKNKKNGVPNCRKYKSPPNHIPINITILSGQTILEKMFNTFQECSLSLNYIYNQTYPQVLCTCWSDTCTYWMVYPKNLD